MGATRTATAAPLATAVEAVARGLVTGMATAMVSWLAFIAAAPATMAVELGEKAR